MGRVLDPLDLPSGGKVIFGDPDVLFKAGHYRRLSAIFIPQDDGTIEIPRVFDNAGSVIGVASIMAESLITSWTVPYLADAPIPAKDPAVLDQLSWPDLRAIGSHAITTALDLAGIEVRKKSGEPDDPKGQPSEPPNASSGATPGTGSNPSSAPTALPAEYVTPEQLSSLTSPTP